MIGFAAARPFAAHAQQSPKHVPKVGALIGFAEQDPATQRRVAAFVTALRDLGWVLGRSIAIDFRYGAGDAEKNRVFAKELVGLQPDVIFVNSTSATTAVQRETKTIPVVFATVSDPVGSLMSDPFLTVNTATTNEKALQFRVPVVSGISQSGALISYAPDTDDLFRRSAAYVDKILRGASPADLPVQLPTKFDLVVNLRTAKALGLSVPQTLIAGADEVIE
jgi:ABC-type uncharacterized transport system substrate-binding protein